MKYIHNNTHDKAVATILENGKADSPHSVCCEPVYVSCRDCPGYSDEDGCARNSSEILAMADEYRGEA